jgi:seryl-tRNA synthetase
VNDGLDPFVRWFLFQLFWEFLKSYGTKGWHFVSRRSKNAREVIRNLLRADENVKKLRVEVEDLHGDINSVENDMKKVVKAQINYGERIKTLEIKCGVSP